MDLSELTSFTTVELIYVIAALGLYIPMSMKQPPKAVSAALFRAIDEGRFLACNVPDYEQLLLDRATSLYDPIVRAYPQLEPVIAASARAAASRGDA